jgi:uncharacterized protein YcbK (DUF882 family)
MAPPTRRPRLYQIDPVELSHEFAKVLRNTAADHLERIGATFPNAEEYEQAAQERMESLIHFAQTGRKGVDMACTLQDLSKSFEQVKKHKQQTTIQLVFHAAEARLLITQKNYVSARALGALADLSEAQIRNILCKKMDFSRKGIPHRLAKTFLEERKVAGFHTHRNAA